MCNLLSGLVYEAGRYVTKAETQHHSEMEPSTFFEECVGPPALAYQRHILRAFGPDQKRGWVRHELPPGYWKPGIEIKPEAWIDEPWVRRGKLVTDGTGFATTEYWHEPPILTNAQYRAADELHAKLQKADGQVDGMPWITIVRGTGKHHIEHAEYLVCFDDVYVEVDNWPREVWAFDRSVVLIRVSARELVFLQKQEWASRAPAHIWTYDSARAQIAEVLSQGSPAIVLPERWGVGLDGPWERHRRTWERRNHPAAQNA
jgi:hypothetical protein